MSRLSAAVSRPGIDPRIWHCLAFVEKVTVDPDEGIFADVILMPTEDRETCRIATVYSGPGFGFYFPIEEGDEVMVWAPNGDPDEGLVCMPHLWSKSDPPPPDVTNSTKVDVLLHVKSGQNLSIKVEGGGKIKLGSVSANEPLVLGKQWQSLMSSFLNVIITHTHLFPALLGAPTSPPFPTDLIALQELLASVSSGDQLSEKAFTEK